MFELQFGCGSASIHLASPQPTTILFLFIVTVHLLSGSLDNVDRRAEFIHGSCPEFVYHLADFAGGAFRQDAKLLAGVGGMGSSFGQPGGYGFGGLGGGFSVLCGGGGSGEALLNVNLSSFGIATPAASGKPAPFGSGSKQFDHVHGGSKGDGALFTPSEAATDVFTPSDPSTAGHNNTSGSSRKQQQRSAQMAALAVETSPSAVAAELVVTNGGGNSGGGLFKSAHRSNISSGSGSGSSSKKSPKSVAFGEPTVHTLPPAAASEEEEGCVTSSSPAAPIAPPPSPAGSVHMPSPSGSGGSAGKASPSPASAPAKLKRQAAADARLEQAQRAASDAITTHMGGDLQETVSLSVRRVSYLRQLVLNAVPASAGCSI